MQVITQHIRQNGVSCYNVDSDGQTTGLLPVIAIGIDSILVVNVRNLAGELTSIPGSEDVVGWKFVLANDWSRDTENLFSTQVIVANDDRSSFTIDIDGTRTEFMLTALGTKKSITMGCELIGINIDGTWEKPNTLLQWDITIGNRRDKGNDDPDLPQEVLDDYVLKAVMGGYFGNYTATDSEVDAGVNRIKFVTPSTAKTYYLRRDEPITARKLTSSLGDDIELYFDTNLDNTLLVKKRSYTTVMGESFVVDSIVSPFALAIDGGTTVIDPIGIQFRRVTDVEAQALYDAGLSGAMTLEQVESLYVGDDSGVNTEVLTLVSLGEYYLYSPDEGIIQIPNEGSISWSLVRNVGLDRTEGIYKYMTFESFTDGNYASLTIKGVLGYTTNTFKVVLETV